MKTAIPRSALWLSWLIVALAACSSTIGLLFRDMYNDPELFIHAGWLGNDLATLILAVPILSWGTLNAAMKPAARLVWLGSLSFMVYNYAFYLFGAAPNRLLVLYIALVSLSLLALLLGIMDPSLPKDRQPSARVRRFLSTYMIIWAAALTAIWGIQGTMLLLTGDVPDLNGSAHAFRVTAALDLTLVVPYVTLAVALLLRRSAWAVPVAAILNIKGVLYPIVLIASSVTSHRAGIDGALTLVPLWIGFVVASSVACRLLLRKEDT